MIYFEPISSDDSCLLRGDAAAFSKIYPKSFVRSAASELATQTNNRTYRDLPSSRRTRTRDVQFGICVALFHAEADEFYCFLERTVNARSKTKLKRSQNVQERSDRTDGPRDGRMPAECEPYSGFPHRHRQQQSRGSNQEQSRLKLQEPAIRCAASTNIQNTKVYVFVCDMLHIHICI